MENKRFLECCCTDATEAVEAMRGGAGRVELCEDLPCGGVTPSRADIEAALKAVNIPVNVLIRVRGGDFVYDETEIEAMIGSVRMCRELGVNGVVVGALRADGSVDTEAVGRLMAEAQGLCVTFHRAFDECARKQAQKHREILAHVEAELNLPKSLRRYATKAMEE